MWTLVIGNREPNTASPIVQIMKHFRLLFSILLITASGLALSGAVNPKNILFFGDSLTAGYGLDDPTTQAFPGVVQTNLDAAGLPYRVINAGLSGETSSGGIRRIDWVLRQPVAVFVLELGGNDGLRGLPLDLLRDNLEKIIARVRLKNPDALILVAGMEIPPSMGAYASDFAALFPRLARSTDSTLIPQLLDGVGGIPTMNLPDGIHPTPAGHTRIAENIWSVLKPLLP
jgi:acyl-CoA thioesterase-1